MRTKELGKAPLPVRFIGMGVLLGLLWGVPNESWGQPQKDPAQEVMELIGYLKAEDPNVRREAAADLGEIAPTVAFLSTMDPQQLPQGSVIEALQEEPPLLHVLEAVILALLDALQDEDMGVREEVAQALGGVAKKIEDGTVQFEDEAILEKAFPPLTALLRHEQPGVRKGAVLALRRIGTQVRNEAVLQAALPSLMEMALQDEKQGIKAAYAIGGMAVHLPQETIQERIISPLAAVLEGDDRKGWWQVMGMMRGLTAPIEEEAKLKPFLPLLIPALQHRDTFSFNEGETSMVCLRAVDALESIVPKISDEEVLQPVFQALLPVLADEEERMRRGGEWALLASGANRSGHGGPYRATRPVGVS